MRLIRFYVRKHLLLQDLDLRFDRPGRLDTGQYALDFLVGVNGSGKSTLLRALTQVFVYLENGGKRPFEFELEYELDNNSLPIIISISEIEETIKEFSTRKLKITNKNTNEVLDNRNITNGSVMENQHLPKRNLIYSTGSEKEWERLLNRAQEDPGSEDASVDILKDSVQRSIKELPGSMAKVNTKETADNIPPFWLMRTEHMPIITLCGLLAHLASENKLLNDVIEALGIQSVTGFSLRFRLHSALSSFEEYNKLSKLASRRMRQGTDYLLHFDLSSDPEIVEELLKEFNGSFELYRVLEKISQKDKITGQPTLQQVSVFLQRKYQPKTDDDQPEENTIPNLFLLDWLSDGEQSFLGRMALLSMLDTDDSLILLDEPEVHFNDYWKREVVNLLDTVMSSHTNHLLITTHSSILLSDVTEENVTILVKDINGWSRRQFLRLPLLAVDPSEIMVNYFGTGRSVGARSTRLLTDVVEKGNLEELEKYLNMVGPGYWRYRIQARLEELRASSS